jgi:3,4-dihydroxy 2-butanone 4-phosphate synthase/GTP cyclohydrolase II
MSISPINEIVEEMRAGRMVILVDEEDRENEGDLVLAADFVTPEAINFMAKYGRGPDLPNIDGGALPRVGSSPNGGCERFFTRHQLHRIH